MIKTRKVTVYDATNNGSCQYYQHSQTTEDDLPLILLENAAAIEYHRASNKT